MSKIVKLYCEGERGSHDYDILEKLIPSFSIKIDPIGGKKGAGSAIDARQKIDPDRADYYFFFRDRDFDKDLRELRKESLFIDYKKDSTKNVVGEWCFSYRTTIENYLLDIKLFFQFLIAENLATLYDIASEEKVTQLFIEAAKSIRVYQAVRHTLGEMRRPVDFGTSWTTKSGILPERLDQDFCRTQALSRISEVKSLTDDWNPECFDIKLHAFLTMFDEDFMNRLDFLIWFQGKDFETALQRLLPKFPMKKYYKFAKTNFDFTQFSDLQELRNLLESKL